MKNRKTIGTILKEAGLENSAGFFEGRSVSEGIITPEILLKIYKGLKENRGKKEAEVFKQMVYDLPTLKPSFFIKFTERLDIIGIEDGWWWNKEQILRHYSGDVDLLKMPLCKETEQIKKEFRQLLQQ